MFKRIPDRNKNRLCLGDPLTVLCHHLWLPLRPLALPLSRVVKQPVQDGGGPRRYGGGAAGSPGLVGAGLEGVGAEPGVGVVEWYGFCCCFFFAIYICV